MFTDAKKLIGVEMNDYFCKLQTEMVRKHRLQDRIEVNEGSINTEKAKGSKVHHAPLWIAVSVAK